MRDCNTFDVFLLVFEESKKDMVETAIQMVKICSCENCERTNGHRNTLPCMGIPINDTTSMFEENQILAATSTVPHKVLQKRHNMLAYQRVVVQETIACGGPTFFHISES
jgi:hypothetical protein